MKRAIFFLAIFALFSIWIVFGNIFIETTEIIVSSDSLPDNFKGYKIAHISDLHNAEFGEDNAALLSILKEANPDIIAVTGDIIDSRHTDYEAAIEFIEGATQIAPVYYCTGNHESRLSGYAAFETQMEQLGVNILRNKSEYLSIGDERIMVMGVDDPSFKNGNTADVLSSLKENCFTLLLSHRPDLFNLYSENEIDLTLCGHAHGGQFRLPFIGGLYAPNQGFLPEYDSGIYTEGNSSMIVSRGLGNSLFPFRFNNRPEVIIITLN